MRSYIRRACYIMLMILPILLIAQKMPSPGSEIGDAMFRPIWWTDKLPLHTAIYRNSESSNEWDPSSDIIDSDMEHSVIQARRAGELLGLDNYYDGFLSGHAASSQIGRGYTSSGIDLDGRKTIIATAKSQYGAVYPDFPWGWPEIKAPKNVYPQWPNGSFRCDGLVEYCYEQVYRIGAPDPDDRGFFTEEEETHCLMTFHPGNLMSRMAPEAPSPPVANYITPQDGENVKGQIEIEVTINDGPTGSGVDKVQLFIDNKPVDEPDDEDSDAEKQYTYTWDTDGERNGMHLLRIEAYDRAGNFTEKEIKVYKGEAPYVKWTIPSKGATDVSVDKDRTDIFVVFSEVMDRTSTEEAISISPEIPHNLIWNPDDEAITMYFNEHLEYCKEYTLTILDAATDTAGIHLDGDGNGKPGGNYVFSFTTEKPEIVVEAYPGCVEHIEEGESATHHVISKGDQLKGSVDCRIEFEVNNPGKWSVSGASDENFPLSPGGTYTNTYTSTNMGATAALGVFYQVGAKCALIEGEGYYWSAQGHMHDHPDENQSPGEMNYPTPWICRTRGDSINPGLPDVGIMLSGWADGYGHILGRYDIPTLPVKPNFKIINHPDMLVSDSVKLLVVGSAGLNGQNSQLLAQKLEEYVTSGGNLLVFTQKFGSDLSVLPGGIDGKERDEVNPS